MRRLASVLVAAALLSGCAQGTLPWRTSAAVEQSEPAASLRAAYGQVFREARIETASPEGVRLTVSLDAARAPVEKDRRSYADMALLVSLRPGEPRYEVVYETADDRPAVVWLPRGPQMQFGQAPTTELWSIGWVVNDVTTATLAAVGEGQQSVPQASVTH